MKVLILAAGRGKRMGKLCEENNKCLFEMAGRPLIEYSLDLAYHIDFSDIFVVVGYQAEKIINICGNNYKGKPIKYIYQKEQKGLVHAIECAKEELGREDFMLMLGDELMINPNLNEMINRYYEDDLFCLCGVLLVEDKNLIKKTYAVIQGEDDKIIQLIEKPENVINNLMGTGFCIFKNEILSYIDKTSINPKRNEKELVDLIQTAINDGRKVKSFLICEKFFNINSPTEINEANSYFFHP